jgi:hypothetical protein
LLSSSSSSRNLPSAKKKIDQSKKCTPQPQAARHSPREFSR